MKRKHKQKRKPVDLCCHCGARRADHCVFKPAMIPVTCVCEPELWGCPTDVPDVCGHFEPDGYEPGSGATPICKHCEHEEGCHLEA